MKQNTSFTVKDSTTLMNFLMEKMPQNSKSSIKSLLTHKQVLVNDDAISQYNTPLKNGDIITIVKTRFDKNNLRGVKILYEDNDIIVAEKDRGVLSVSTGKKGEVTAYNILKDYLKTIDPKNKIFIVHRLDRDTSGVMIFAKTPKAQEILQKNWNEIVKKRTYVAVVMGKMEKKSDTIISYLAENKAFNTYITEKNGKKAITTYNTLKSNKNYSLLEVDIETGRKNQIRVHMKSINHPIIGDKKYGGEKNPIRRLGLHAHSIVFTHPITNKLMSYTSDIPREFLSLFKN